MVLCQLQFPAMFSLRKELIIRTFKVGSCHDQRFFKGNEEG